MKLNSTMKHRRLKNRLLISMLTMALRFSYLLISKDNVFNALTYDLWVTDHYTITEDVDYESWLTSNSNQATKIIQTILRLKFDFDGYYDGQYYAIFTGWPTNTYYTIVSSVNCQISEYSTITNAYEITFNGVQHCEIVIQVSNITSSSLGGPPPPFPQLDYINSFFRNFTYVCSSPTYLVERINSKLNDLKDNTDGIEGALSTIANSMTSVNTNLVTINSSLIDIYNRQNVTNNKLDSIVTTVDNLADLLIYSDTEPHNLIRSIEAIQQHSNNSEEYLRQIKQIVQDLNPTQQTNIDTEINTYNNISGQVDTIINNNINTAIGNFPSINNAVNNFIANNVATMNKVRSAITSIMPNELNKLCGTYIMLMAFGMLLVVMLG